MSIFKRNDTTIPDQPRTAPAVLPALVNMGTAEHAFYNQRTGQWDTTRIEMFYELRHPARYWGRHHDGGPIQPLFDTGPKDPPPVKLGTIYAAGFNSGNHPSAPASEEQPRRFNLGPNGFGRPQTSAHAETRLDNC